MSYRLPPGGDEVRQGKKFVTKIVELRSIRETRVGERRRGVSLRGIRKTRVKTNICLGI